MLADQIPFMRRVGFDAFEVTHAPTRRALIEGRIAEVTLHYQPAAPGEDAASRPAALAASQRRLTSASDASFREPADHQFGDRLLDARTFSRLLPLP